MTDIVCIIGSAGFRTYEYVAQLRDGTREVLLKRSTRRYATANFWDREIPFKAGGELARRFTFSRGTFQPYQVGGARLIETFEINWE